uniref:Heat shock factor-binding protein 1-like n=1 Tax=Scleropages formosus TaxID=113540 RepID=A0A8C9VDB7_SCLFO
MSGGSSTAAQDLTHFMETTMQSLQNSLTFPLDEMGTRIDDLEKNVAALMTQAESIGSPCGISLKI